MASSPLVAVFENQGGGGSNSVAWTFILSTIPVRNAERVGVWEYVFSPLQISCYRSFDRSVDFLFEDELLFGAADADIIRHRVSINTTSFRPNDFPWELHRVLASSYPVTCTCAVTVLVCA